jgi:uncharacterized protein (TIGR00730 family)
MPVISIFGSGKATPKSSVYKIAKKAGYILAKNGFDLVTGGYYGVMEAVFIGAKKLDVRRIAVTTKFFADKKSNDFATEIIETETYSERLLKLMEIADAYLVLPGGLGTLLEFSYLYAFKERGIINKPLICYGKQWKKILNNIGLKKKDLKKLKNLDIFLINDIKKLNKILKK